MSTMKEAHVDKDTNVTLHDVPMPKITKPHQIIVKVEACGCNPKDWKMPAAILTTIRNTPNSGDDIAGVVHEVGSDVKSFRPGDRVAGLHQLGAPYGAFAEYAMVDEFSTFHLPDEMSFDVAATLPMICYMAAIGLFGNLKVAPGPWLPLRRPRPLLIYGAASSVGAMAVKMAQAANVHPLICVAGGGIPYVETLISPEKGDRIVDYRGGSEKCVQGMREALGGAKLEYAFDCISEKGSYVNVCEVLDHKTGRITITLPPKKKEVPSTIEQTATMAGGLWQDLSADEDNKDLGDLGLGDEGKYFGLVISQIIGRLIAEGKLVPLQHRVFDDGLLGVETALKLSRAGKAGATAKSVVRIAETPGLR